MYTKIFASKSWQWFPFLLSGSIFLLFFCSQLVEKSMFIDGVWYAGIARNLSQGQGSFWFPQLSETIFAQFHEHPPLVFGLQALFFRMFGDSFWVERLFCLLQYLGIAFGILQIWFHLFKAGHSFRKLWFLPLLLWQLNIVNYYYLPANVLDSSLCFFNVWAIYCLLKFTDTFRKTYLFAGGLWILSALFSKGFVGLFPLAFFGIYAIATQQIRLRQALGYSLLLTSGIIFALLILFVGYPPAWQSVSEYLDVQVLASLNGERRLYHFRESRFFILRQLIIALLPMFLFWIASWVSQRLWIRSTTPRKILTSYVFLFFLMGLSASAPLMISPRQALLYLLPSLPYFSLAVAIGVAPLILNITASPVFRQKMAPLLNGLWVIIGLAGLMLCYQNYGKVNQRDQTVIRDATLIGQRVGQQAKVASDVYNMYISGYLMRDFQISLDTTGLQLEYLISTKDKTPPSSYVSLGLPTQHYVLYRKIFSSPMTGYHE